MSPELIYFTKINVALMLFYAFYRLFFYKDTFFKLRRTILLIFFLLALLHPFFNLQEWVKSKEPIAEVIMIYTTILSDPVNASGEISPASWQEIMKMGVSGIYWLVVSFFIFRFFIQLGSILWLKWTSKKGIIQNSNVYLLEKEAGPFSFFRMIFLHPSSHSEEELNEILTHENTHVNQWHSLDVMVSELICIFCWINPFVWLLKREIRHNLEYLADNKVLESGYDSRSYQYHLLGLAHHSSGSGIYNSFNVLHLKNRILMMNKKRTHALGRTKYLMFLPLAAFLMIFSNIEAVARITKDLATNVIPHPEITEEEDISAEISTLVVAPGVTESSLSSSPKTQNENVSESNTVSSQRPENNSITQPSPETESTRAEKEQTVFMVVEEMPTFPGGDHELLRFIQKSVRYPVIAQENGIQGRVVCSFTVTQTGSIEDIEVVRGIDPSLDQEALRVIHGMPKWEPGKQRGKPVPVRYTMPIAFRLQ